VPIFSLKTEPVQRSQGQSVVACAAYRSATKLYDERIGKSFDYTRRRGVEHAEIVLPTMAVKQDIQWARDRQKLWNTAERCEKRKDGRPAREYLVALAHELTKAQRLALTRAFVAEIANRYNVAVDFAIHQPHRSGDKRNHHAHILTTTRELTATGLGAKASMEWSNTDRYRKGLGATAQEIDLVRTRWESIANDYFRELGLSIRIDRRTLVAQGIDREPTQHLGPAVTGMERRGMKTQVVQRIREQHHQAVQRRLERGAELAKVERERREVEKSIRDLSAELVVAQRGHAGASLEELQREGLERWKAMRAEQREKEPRTIEEQQAQARERWLKSRRAHGSEQRSGLEKDQGQEQGLENESQPSKGLDGPEFE
jgi:hypothetical protein